MKRGRYLLIFFLIMIIISVPLVFAGFFDWIKKITGEAATEGPVSMNISVGAGNAPTITYVSNISAVNLNDGPSNTNLSFNFSVTDSDGFANLNPTSAAINLTNSGVGRVNNTACVEYETDTNDANYTCNVTMWWWDSDGAWRIWTNISDDNGNNASNNSVLFTVNMVTGFVAGPGNLTWGTLNPGSTNQTPSGAADNWITLNNTGNQDVATNNVQVNATDLKGEITSSQALWAANFSVGTTTGSAKPECDLGGATATNMTNGTSGDAFKEIYTSVLAAGNYTVNNNVTGQENLYFCIQKVGLGLSQQRYSTLEEGAWTIKIV